MINFKSISIVIFLISILNLNHAFSQNHSLYFDGIDDCAKIRSFGNLNFESHDFTFELEILPQIKSWNNVESTILSNKINSDGFSIGISTNNTFFINLPGNLIIESNIVGNIYDGNCHQLAVSRQNNEINFYFDKQNIGNSTTSVVYNVNSSNDYFIGVDPFVKNSNYFGNIDNFLLWNYARSIVDFNNAPLCYQGTETGLLALLTFDHEPSYALYDLSINSVFAQCMLTDANKGPTFKDDLCGTICPPIHALYLADPICNRDLTTYTCGVNNLICNGGFEQGAPYPVQGSNPSGAFNNCNTTGSSSEVTNWCGVGTPEYFARGCFNASNSIPTNSIVNSNLLTNPRSLQCTSIDTWSGLSANNNRYVVLKQGDQIWSPLVSSLQPNQTYQLSLRALSINGINNQIQTPPNIPLLKTSIRDNNGTGSVNVALIQIPNNNNCDWKLYTVTFTVTGSFSFNEILIQASNLGSLAEYFLFLDDIELLPLSNNYPIIANGIGSHRPNQIAVDGNNNTYIAGNTSNTTMDWHNGFNTGPNSGFLTSINNCGDIRWANGLDNAFGVAYSSFLGQDLVFVSTFGSNQIITFNANNGQLNSLVLTGNSGNSFRKLKFDNTGRYLFALGGTSQLNTIYRFDLANTSNPISGIFNIFANEITDFDVIDFDNIVYCINGGFSNEMNVYKYSFSSSTTSNQYKFTNNSGSLLRINSICMGQSGTFAIGGYYNCDGISTGAGIEMNIHNGIAQTTSTPIITPGSLTKTTLGYNAWSAIISPTTPTPINNKWLGGDDLFSWVSSIIYIKLTNEFVFSGVYTSNGLLSTNLQFSLPSNTNGKRQFISYKQSETNGADIWYKTAVPFGLGIGSTTTDMIVGLSNNIYATGYIMGDLDFLQGDVISSGNNCDNIWVCNINDYGNNSSFARLLNTSPFSYNEKYKKAIICNSFESIQNFEYYDQNYSELYSMMGTLLLKNNISSQFNNLAAGSYILSPNTKTKVSPILIIKQ
ncbi:MAG: hypothetical protein RL516_1799 [Bacteroidota bacterium]|jgi:hypothetical protein